jgi:hypothetical protein
MHPDRAHARRADRSAYGIATGAVKRPLPANPAREWLIVTIFPDMRFTARRTGQDQDDSGKEIAIVQPQQRETPGPGPRRSEDVPESVDLVRGQRAALESGDDVVQQLCIAKYALAAGDTERAISAVDAALEMSRHSLSDLLGNANSPDAVSHAGTLVRSMAAGSSSSERPAPVAPQRHGNDRI